MTNNRQVLRDPDELVGTIFPAAAAYTANATAPLEDLVLTATNAGGRSVYSATEYQGQDDDAAANLTAPFLPRIENHEYPLQAIETELAIREGNRNGLLAREEEMEAIAKAQREIRSIQLHADMAVQAGNKEARRRANEGIQMPEQTIYSGVDIFQSSMSKEKTNFEQLQRQGGYKVEEYDVQEYKVGEYNADYEYKSVYDD